MIVRKTPADVEKMRAAGRIVAEVLASVEKAVVPEVTTTGDLNRLAEAICRERGGYPTFLGYNKFPAAACISVNNEVVHGLPGGRVLRSGDLVSFDFACTLNGFVADAAITIPVGEVSSEARRLLGVTREALYQGIAKARVGGRIGEIASTIQRYVEAAGFSVVRELVGHGVGRTLHEDPSVPNFGKPGQGARLMEGMTLAIEPMVNLGKRETETMDDQWTVVTKDGSLSAHFEHTVAITKRGADILTLPWDTTPVPNQSARTVGTHTAIV
ncbi:MAG: type I methionyl aminopeptidase [Armatimonadetes bacterium]|nr:type I methionyl aminopeptidase [Armatimonadota bacterium]